MRSFTHKVNAQFYPRGIDSTSLLEAGLLMREELGQRAKRLNYSLLHDDPLSGLLG
jgi:hypothetical protein